MVVHEASTTTSNSSTKSGPRPRHKVPYVNCEVGGDVGVRQEKKHRLKQRFEVIRKLGQGTYGKVQLAINKETGQEVAIKTIKKSKIESEQDLVRIRREIQIMSSIQHPHIIHIFEVFENKEKIVLVMQYASGGELYEYVSERKVLNDNEARRLFRQIATAIYYCHKNKVCHRDLKLENLLLDEKGNGKIGDFGLSNVFDEKHYLNTFCGSPLYASPEIVKGNPYYGPEVDCWSMGVILYTLVYGAMPFDGSNFKRLVKQISEANYFEPKQKSDASGLIQRLLTVNPAKRATIIDICTDWWVNRGYEHTLLQVAEDMANLTPVRLDVLLALAPSSPTAAEPSTPLVGEKEKKAPKKKSKPRRQEMTDDSLGPNESTDISTDIPTYPEEDEEAADIMYDNDAEFLPSSVAAALEEECQGQSTKRQASTSFDQSMTRIPSHVVKKKKPKKAVDDSEVPSSDKQVSSGYVSEATDKATSSEAPSLKTGPSPQTEPQSKAAPQGPVPKEVPAPEEAQTSDKSKTTVRREEDPQTPAKAEERPKTSKVKEAKAKAASASSLPQVKPQVPAALPPPPQQQEKQTVAELEETVSTTPVTTTPTATTPVIPTPGTPTAATPASQGPPSLSNRGEAPVQPLPDAPPKPSLQRMSSITTPPGSATPSDSTPSTPAEYAEDAKEKRKQSIERRTSLGGKRVGRLFIPNFDSQSNQVQRKPVPSYGSITDAKKKLLERRESMDPEKERIFPTIPVTDAKNDLERRASVAVIDITRTGKGWSRAGQQSTDGSETDESERRLGQGQNQVRSQSLVEPLMSPRKVLDAAIIDRVHEEEEDHQDRDYEDREPTEEELKDMAKQVLKKQLAKACLQHKQRQASVDSMGSGASNQPIVESPDVVLSGPSFVKAPRPYVREVEPATPVVKSTAEIKLTPRQILEESESEATLGPESPQPQVPGTPGTCPSKQVPITRSYKKVTFTKDGACVTETGKIISQEGADGTVTRVEKKSKVTHYPTEGADAGGAPTRTESREEKTTTTTFGGGSFDDGLATAPQSPPPFSPTNSQVRRSESVSSSGSTDIFEDIFDTWSGDAMFGNMGGKMKSLFQGITPLTGLMGKKKHKKKSRAESCDRKPEDVSSPSGPFRKTSHATLTDQESDTDNENESPFAMAGPGGGLFKFLRSNSPSSRLIDKHRSLFTKHFGPENDLFADAESFSPSFGKNYRDRTGSTSSVGSRLPQTGMRLVFGPGRGGFSRNAGPKQDSFESSDGNATENYTTTTPRESVSSSIKTPAGMKAYTRTWSKETTDSSPSDARPTDDDEDSSSSRRRVEQWLHMSPDNEIGENHPISMYSTIRPRPQSKYARTMSNKLSTDLDDESDATFIPSQQFPIGGHFRRNFGEPLSRTTSMGSRPGLQMRMTFGPGIVGAPSRIVYTSQGSTASEPFGSGRETGPAGEFGGDTESWESPVVLPESSSLLDQLRAHGYKNLVNQRLVSSELETVPRLPLDPPSDGTYKRGKSPHLPNSPSQGMQTTMNGACNGNSHETVHSNDHCMERTQTNRDLSPKPDDNPRNGVLSVDDPATYSSPAYSETNCASAESRTVRKQLVNPVKDLVDVSLKPSASNQRQNDMTRRSSSNGPRGPSMDSPPTETQIQTQIRSLNTQSSANDLLISNQINQNPSSNHRSVEQSNQLSQALNPIAANQLTNPSTNDYDSTQETVQERIHRKSFYSRFNEDSALGLSLSRRPSQRLKVSPHQGLHQGLNPTLRNTLHNNHQRRSASYVDGDGGPLPLPHTKPHSASSASSFKRGSSVSSMPSSQSKPPLVSSSISMINPSSSSASDDWFARMESRANLMLEEMRASHRGLMNIGDPNRRSRDRMEGTPRPDSARRRSSSLLRSPLAGSEDSQYRPNRHSSSFIDDSDLGDYQDTNGYDSGSTFSRTRPHVEPGFSDLTSPAEVMRRAMDLMNRKANNE